MFASRKNLGLQQCQISGSTDRPASSVQLRFTLQTAQRPAFASLSASFGEILRNLPWNQQWQSAASDSGAGAQTEPKTNTNFEERFCQRGNSKCGSLAGVGVRSKKIAGVKTINVYALGLYVDVPAAKGVLRPYRSKPPEKLVKDQSFYDALINADHVDKTIHMSIAFGRISSGQFWEAIREQLAVPMQQAGADADLQQFATTFEGVKFRKAFNLSLFNLSLLNDGTIEFTIAQIDGKDAGTIKSPALCQSLLGVYLGEKAVSPDAKESIGSGLAAMLAE